MRFALLLLIGGGALAFFGFKEFQLAQVAKPEAAAVACAELEAGAAPDNAHVLMGDFSFVASTFVYKEKKDGSGWTEIWIPAVPLDGEYMQALAEADKAGKDITTVKPKKINVIVKSKAVPGRDALNSLGQQDTIDGLLVNKIESLSGDERELLVSNYPGVNFDTCFILEHGRTLRAPWEYFGMMGGGAVLILGGVGVFVTRRKV